MKDKTLIGFLTITILCLISFAIGVGSVHNLAKIQPKTQTVYVTNNVPEIKVYVTNQFKVLIVPPDYNIPTPEPDTVPDNTQPQGPSI